MRSIVRRLAATLGAALLATVPLITVVGSAPANASTDELTASFTGETYYSTLVYSNQEYRQTFQASVTGELTRTRVWVVPQWGDAYPVPASVSVYNLNADNTLGALVDTASATINSVSWPGPTTDLATFIGGQTLTAGEHYALVIRPLTPASGGFYARLAGPYPYSSGTGYVCTPGTEDCSTNSLSVWFEVYVSTLVSDSTPPVVSLSVAPDPVLQGLTATATFSATDDESDITDMTCPASFTVDTSMAGERTITCGATSAGGTSAAAYTYTVLSPAEGIANLKDDVVAELPAKTASPLISLLNSATKSLSKDDPSGAIDKLSSFIAQVNAQAGKKIPVDVAAALVIDAEMLIDSIEASSS